MSAEVWGVVAAFAGVGAAFMAVFVAAFFWLMSAIQKLGQEIRTEFQEERRARQVEFQEERRARQAENQEERRERQTENQEERRKRQTENQEERRERQTEIQRLFDALYRHRHDQSDSMYVPADDD